MEHHRRLSRAAVALLVVGLAAGSCRGPEGPPGPPGETTVVNIEGFAQGIRCGTCHDPDQDTTYYVLGRKYQWQLSKHAIGGEFERSTSTCAGCHTTEGFVQRMQNKPVSNHAHPSPPGCFSCHSPHARGNFSLRTVAPVTLTSSIVGVPNQTFNYGKGNLCAQCHQPRTLSPAMNANAPGDSLVIRTSRWHTHYGVQAQMLMGEGGFKFPGYNYTGNSPHTNSTAIRQEGCIACHMADPVAGQGIAGGHTMNLRYVFQGVERSLLAGCNQSGCHANLTTIDYKGIQTEVRANLDTLFQLLVARGWIDGNPASPNYKLVNLIGGQRVIKPAVKAGAIYNYFFVEHDRSDGAHNSRYTLELLRSSIAELRKP